MDPHVTGSHRGSGGGGLQESTAQEDGLVSSGVDRGPGDSLHQQLQSKEKKRVADL